ncbi:tyrosine recombinase [Corallococcus coralloides DSM 2259]|uniref:Tyrosine recombinase n=1 Tax=Corallococcus coralloides (strain ATCC 25202 / DSM 2259 / NBRC 100086 / M2) TaxID=1144275 RepID=H8MQ15_CORCM|nr:tyrosine recombinase [Corallococcus coralloides DSM 2259]
MSTLSPLPVLGLRDKAILEMLYGGGLRISELCGLDLLGVERSSRIVRVMGKGSKERRGELLATVHDGQDPDALFLNFRGGRLTPRSRNPCASVSRDGQSRAKSNQRTQDTQSVWEWRKTADLPMPTRTLYLWSPTQSAESTSGAVPEVV